MVLDLLQRINARVQTWKAPYRSQEMVLELLKDWHVRVNIIFVFFYCIKKVKWHIFQYEIQA